jgi:hypothetical protein
MSGIQIMFSLKYVRRPVTYHNEWCWSSAQSDLFKIPVCLFMPLEGEHFYFALVNVTSFFDHYFLLV